MADHRTAARVLEDIAERLDGRGDDASRLLAVRLRWALAEFLDDGPPDTDRRDALLAEAAARFLGAIASKSGRAHRLRRALTAYAAGPWIEACHLDDPPAHHRDRLAGACWRILQADPGILSADRLRRKLGAPPSDNQRPPAVSPPTRSTAS